MAEEKKTSPEQEVPKIVEKQVSPEQEVPKIVEKKVSPEQEFLKKHKQKSRAEIKLEIKKGQDIREQHTKDLSNIERNLTSFLEKEDPMVDPGTGNVLAWIRQLPYIELISLTPEDIRKAAEEGKSREDIEKMLREDTDRDGDFYLMSKLISRPQKTPEEWKKIATSEFITLFDITLYEIISRTSQMTDFF